MHIAIHGWHRLIYFKLFVARQLTKLLPQHERRGGRGRIAHEQRKPASLQHHHPVRAHGAAGTVPEACVRPSVRAAAATAATAAVRLRVHAATNNVERQERSGAHR